MHLRRIHHVAIICSDYQVSKKFYTEILGFKILGEYYREERQSYKLDLAIDDHYALELFSFPKAPPRLSRPEGCGLRHIAFAVNNIDEAIKSLQEKNVDVEPVRVDEWTGKRFTFFADPDQLPIELYEQ